MKTWLIFFFLLLLPSFVFAQNQQILWQFDLNQDGSINDFGLEFFYFQDVSANAQDNTLTVKGQGKSYIVVPKGEFEFKDYNNLEITLKSDSDFELRTVADVQKTAESTYDMRYQIKKSDELQTYNFSLSRPYFKKDIENIAIIAVNQQLNTITIKEIKLTKNNSIKQVGVALKDFFVTDSYSPYTPNFFAIPQIFGRPTIAYLLPIIILAILFLLYSKKYKKTAIVILLIMWIVIDLRVSGEFISYAKDDYQNWIKPKYEEKVFRNDRDLYQFIDFVNNNLPDKVEMINYYSAIGTYDDTNRKLQYYLYPILVRRDSLNSKYYVVYKNASIKYNADDNKLYSGDEVLSDAGEVIASFNSTSFIFKEYD
ncbi:hypothetical protein KKA15_01295 [Patescibacteria group bacterium]|nr:hypothetical protein [Patescibacteria group bacterium]